MKTTSFAKTLLPLTFPLLLTACIDEVAYLDQGWNESNQYRELSYSTSQGSQLIPYAWFNHLTVAGGQALVKSDEVIEQLKYLPDYFPDDTLNPDRLPVGFVKDSDPETGEWLGINCAACHTGQIIVGQTALRIDGAPAMGDYIGLLTTVRDALADTLADKKKMKRFAKAVLSQKNKDAVARLKVNMQNHVSEITGMIRRNHSVEHMPGYGRVDAFSSIRNEVFEHDLGIAENHTKAIAPVSYPFLWGTPELDKVQWAGNVENPYARNTGQVLGVLGRLNLKDPSQLFQSSVRRENLFNLEYWLSKLDAPQWPEQYLGTLDNASIERGKVVYQTVDASGYSCIDCHSLKDENGQYPLTPAQDNLFGKQFVKTTVVPINEINTDSNAVAVVYDQKPVQTGLLSAVFDGETELVGATFLSLITQYTVGSLFQQSPALSAEQQALYSDFRFYADDYTPPPLVVGYKARPLAGVWATGPYLHNGSVPNLYELLLPAAQRSESFWVGSQHFDTQRVGFLARPEQHSFYFDTTLSGNSNHGHEYGTGFSESEREDLLEFLKSL